MSNKERRSGRLVKAVRVERRLTQEAVSEQAGINQGHLSLWEQGKRVASDRFARAVAHVLDMDFEELRILLEEERYNAAISKMEKQFDLQMSTLPSGRRKELRGRAKVYTEGHGTLTSVVGIPVLSEVPAGNPPQVTDDIREETKTFEYLPRDIVSDIHNVFALKMTDRNVVVDVGVTPEDGDSCLVMIGDTPELQEIHSDGDILILQSANRRPIILRPDDGQEVRIIGKVIKITENP